MLKPRAGGAPRHSPGNRITGCPVLFLLLLTLPTMAEAQYTYLTNEDGATITITGYNGPGGPVSIPSSIDGLPVTCIGDSAFKQHFGLTGIIIPDSVTTISNWAFAYTALTSVTVPNRVTWLGDYVFTSCYGLTSVTIPPSVPGLGREAFSYCTHLASVTLSYGLSSIGTNAFQDCDGLGSIIIPASVTNLAYEALVGCYALSGVYFEGDAPQLEPYAFYNDTSTVYYLPQTTGWGATFGGHPTVVWNPLQIQTNDGNFGVQGSQFGFTISGSSGQVVVVDASTNLATAGWTSLQAITLTGGSAYFNDPRWTNFPSRVYRVRLP